MGFILAYAAAVAAAACGAFMSWSPRNVAALRWFDGNCGKKPNIRSLGRFAEFEPPGRPALHMFNLQLHPGSLTILSLGLFHPTEYGICHFCV